MDQTLVDTMREMLTSSVRVGQFLLLVPLLAEISKVLVMSVSVPLSRAFIVDVKQQWIGYRDRAISS